MHISVCLLFADALHLVPVHKILAAKGSVPVVKCLNKINMLQSMTGSLGQHMVAHGSRLADDFLSFIRWLINKLSCFVCLT